MPPGSPESLRLETGLKMCKSDFGGTLLRFDDDDDQRMAVDEEDDGDDGPQNPTVLATPAKDNNNHPLPPAVLVQRLPDVTQETALVEEEVSSRTTPRCSYEEMVHLTAAFSSNERAEEEDDEDNRTIVRRLIVLTQWTLTLQEVYQDQVEHGVKPTAGKCVCSKTLFLEKELRSLQNRLLVDPHSDDEEDDNEEERDLNRIQALLKANVSIQISHPTVDNVRESRRLVREVHDPTRYLKTVVDNLINIIKGLLPCISARHYDSSEGFTEDPGSGVMEQEEEEDMSLRVASVSTSSEPKVRARKRKQVLKSKSPPVSPTGNNNNTSLFSPSKKPRKVRAASFGGTASAAVCPVLSPSSPAGFRPFHKANVIDMLEKNKKMVKTNGLYQFVLWREALKAEKDRAGTAKGHKRLSFDL